MFFPCRTRRDVYNLAFFYLRSVRGLRVAEGLIGIVMDRIKDNRSSGGKDRSNFIIPERDD